MIQAASVSDPTGIYRWRNRLTIARRVQETHRISWTEYRELFLYGDLLSSIFRVLRLRADAVRVNMASAYVRSTLPRLIYRTPKVLCSARRPGDEESASNDTILLNYLFREMRAWNTFKLVGLDALMFGCGFVKFGFDSEYHFDPKSVITRIEGSAMIDALRNQVREIREFAGLGSPDRPALAPKTKPFDGKRTSTDEYNTLVVKERPWMLRVSPYDLLIDPDAKSLDDAKWVAHRIVRPIEDVRDDESYTAARKEVQAETWESMPAGVTQGSIESGDPVFPGYDGDPRMGTANYGQSIHSITRDQSAGYARFGGVDDDSRPGLISLFEIWDRRTDTVRTVTMGLDKYLREPAANPFEIEGGLPFEMLGFNDVPDRFYPKSDFADLMPKQIELNRIRQFSLQWLKRIAAKVVTISKMGVLSTKQKDQLTGPESFIHIESEMPGALADLIQRVDMGEFDGAIYEVEERLRRDLKDELGIGSEQFGNAQEDTTATATASAEAARDVRIDEKRRAMEEFAGRCARKILSLSAQFFPPSVVGKITGGAVDKWVEISAEDVRADLDIEIEADSATKPNDEVRRRQLVELLGTIAPLMVPGPMGTPTLPSVWRELIKPMLTAYGFSDPERILDTLEGKVAGQDPMLAAMMAQQQGAMGQQPGMSMPGTPSTVGSSGVGPTAPGVAGQPDGVPGAFPAVPGGAPVGAGLGGILRAQAGAV